MVSLDIDLYISLTLILRNWNYAQFLKTKTVQYNYPPRSVPWVGFHPRVFIAFTSITFIPLPLKSHKIKSSVEIVVCTMDK